MKQSSVVKNVFIAAAITGLCVLSPSLTWADAAKGQGVYMNFCASCHDSGIAGAPKVGDKSDWQARLTQGIETLENNAIKGFRGKKGFMPAKGGIAALSGEEVKFAVQYMLEQSRQD